MSEEKWKELVEGGIAPMANRDYYKDVEAIILWADAELAEKEKDLEFERRQNSEWSRSHKVNHETIIRLASEKAAREKAEAALCQIKGKDTPWPLWDVLVSVATAARHLLKVHNCDCDGWEKVEATIPHAERYMDILCHQDGRPYKNHPCPHEAELADIKETHRNIVEGKCADDEKHCACVPALRAEVKRLVEELSIQKSKNNAIRDTVLALEDQVDRMRGGEGH